MFGTTDGVFVRTATLQPRQPSPQPLPQGCLFAPSPRIRSHARALQETASVLAVVYRRFESYRPSQLTK